MPSEYLEWIWEIPVSPDTVSVGYVAPGAAVKARRPTRTESIFGTLEVLFHINTCEAFLRSIRHMVEGRTGPVADSGSPFAA